LSQFAFEKDGSATEKKLGFLVTDLLKKANAALDESQAWGHTIVPKVDITAKDWAEAMWQFTHLRDEYDHEIPCQVYTVGTPKTGKQLAISGDSMGMEAILKQLAAQAGMTAAMAGPCAVAGSDEQVKRFAETRQAQPAYSGEFESRILHRLVMREASLIDVVGFLNRAPDGNDLNYWNRKTLKYFGHEKYLVNFDGSNVPVGDFLSAIAAAVGMPASKLFSESDSEPNGNNAK
jgi:hypothetical protein